MEFDQNYQRYKELYDDEKKLSKLAVMEELLTFAEEINIDVFIAITCIKISNQKDPYALRGKQIDQFIELIDPIISAALNGRMLRQ